MFNVLVSLGITWCLFVLGRLWTGSAWLGLLIAFVHSLLCGANVWVRHLVPYQEALLLCLMALLLLSRTSRTPKRDAFRVGLAGALTALGCACYLGYYPFVAINGAVALVRSRRWLSSAGTFGLVFAGEMGLFELLSRFAGHSYFHDLRWLSKFIHKGDMREGYVFLWRYLHDVEGIVGVVLFGLFAVFALAFLWRSKAVIPRAARVAILAAIVCYLFHATMGVVFERMVFYDRLLGVYLPFLVVGAVLAIVHLRSTRLRQAAVCMLLCASVASFALFAAGYANVVYPADFLQATMTHAGRGVAYPPDVLWGFVDGRMNETVESFDDALINVADSCPDGSDVYVYLASHHKAPEGQAQFIGVNLKDMGYVAERAVCFSPPASYRLLAVAPHWETFPAIAYEGRKPWERRRITERQPTMRIYERRDEEAHVAAANPHTNLP